MAVLSPSVPQTLHALLGLKPSSQLVEAVDEGLDISAFEQLAKHLALTEKRLADLLRINTSTLARRKRSGKLDVNESERLYRLAFLLERSIQVLGTLASAQRWLDTPKRILADQSPLAFARTEPGAREVEDLLGRLEYGIPS